MPRAIKDKRKHKLFKQRKVDGICVVCGKNPPRVNEVGCDYCYSLHAEYMHDLTSGLRELGFCVQCRAVVHDKNPKTGRRYARCNVCRGYQNKKRGSYHVAHLQKMVEAKICFDCGVAITLINKVTGQPFRRCLPCRISRANKAA